MPFGGSGSRDIKMTPRASVEPVAEGGQASDTVAQIGDPGAVPAQPPPAVPPPAVPATTDTALSTLPPLATTPVAPPPAVSIPRPQPTPPPVTASAPPSTQHELSEREAIAKLNDTLTAQHPYDVSADCIDVRSEGYRNVGYTLVVRDSCAADPRTLGRWRVDARTGEVFRQQEDGRYLRP
jgi:hypothetical protein